MEPLTTVVAAVLIITGGMAILFWPWIVEFFTDRVIPWARQFCGTRIGDIMAEMLAWLNGKVNPLRARIRQLIATFKENFLGIKTTFTKVSSIETKAETVTLIQREDGQIVEKVLTRTVPWEYLPDEVCSEMIRQQKKAALIDDHAVILKEAEKREALVLYA